MDPRTVAPNSVNYVMLNRVKKKESRNNYSYNPTDAAVIGDSGVRERMFMPSALILPGLKVPTTYFYTLEGS